MDAMPVTKVEMNFSASSLINMDSTSKSDPMLVLYQFNRPSNRYTEVFRSEWIQYGMKSYLCDYFFEEVQQFKAEIYDVDKPTPGMPLTSQDFLGSTVFTLGEAVGARGQTVVKNLVLDTRHPQAGSLRVQVEEVSDNNANIMLQFYAQQLDKKDFFGSSDPFLQILRTVEGSDPVLVYKTEEIKNNINPIWGYFSYLLGLSEWNAFAITMQKLCNGDEERPLIFEVWDWNRSGDHELIGRCQSSLRAIKAGLNVSMNLIEPTIKQKKGASYFDSGKLMCGRCDITREPSFLEYLRGGCQVSLIAAIDFTASNGDPRQPTSLHFLNPTTPNEYYQAIMQVGEILEPYDSDKMYPAFGFGGKIPPTMQVSHCFPLNFNPQQPEVFGIRGILDSYVNCLQSVKLYGPTNFTEIINMAMGYASQYVDQQHQQYFILLIITDGEITDMDQTVQALVRASGLPLSVVIVGVGKADFTNMNRLDGDDGRLGYGGQYAERDIVQFVPFRQYYGAPPGKLAKDTLAEIPGQLLSYMKKKGIVPNQPPPPPPIPQMAGLTIGQPGPPPPVNVNPPQGPPPPVQGDFVATHPEQAQVPQAQGPPPPVHINPQGPPPPVQGDFVATHPTQPTHAADFPQPPPPPQQYSGTHP